MVMLLKHHALLCPSCGQVQVSSARGRAKCLACGRSWALCQRGITIGVLGSYWRPQEAGEHVKTVKALRAPWRADGSFGPSSGAKETRMQARMEVETLCAGAGKA